MAKTTKDILTANFITHGGTFHADEVVATVILSKVFEDVNIFRTFKVPEDLSKDVIVFDIGGGKFDHHQKGGNGARENGVPYASCGLIWKEFGHELVANTPNPELVWQMVDRDLIQSIDATDNGQMPTADYPAQAWTINKMISSFNPTWDSNEDSDKAFEKAVSFAETVFDNVLATAIANAKAQSIVEKAIEESQEHIMVLDEFLPWQEFIFTSTNPKAEELWFVVFPSNRGGYNWQCVPDAFGSFGQRKSVPSEWCGAKPEELQKMTGVATATFCHATGFLGATDTKNDAIELARLASRS